MEYYSNTDYVTSGDSEAAYQTAGTSDNAPADKLDIMSFLSVFTELDDKRENRTGRLFLTVHLGPWNNMFLPHTPYHGASFSVTLVRRKDLLHLAMVDHDPRHLIPGLVALKTPRLKQEPTPLQNSRLFRSITKEYQILRSEVLRSHGNIVTVYGCCWQSLDVYGGRPIPSLILEGTKLGNLVHFSRTRQLTLRERLRLSINISSGLQAIHAVGVVHGDLKPENILVFHSTARGYIAKIADFGDAIPLSSTALPSRAPRGTPLYIAPECYGDALISSRDELFKTDIFSLGITLASVLQGMHVVKEITRLAAASGSALESLKESGQFSHWVAELDCRHLEHAAVQDDTGDDEGEDEWVTDLTWREDSLVADEHLWLVYLQLLRGLLSANVEQRYGSAEVVLSNLRIMLRLHLRGVLKRPKVISRPNPMNPNRDWAHMGQVTGMSRARLRKLVGVNVGLPKKLNEEEIEAISLWCQSSGDFLREAQFIRKHALTSRDQTSRQSRNLRRGRTSSIPKEALRLAIHMIDIASSRIQRQSETSADLKITGLEKKVFKASKNCNLFWSLPYAVKKLLESRLEEEAMDDSASEEYRADAAYEYAILVLNSEELPTSRLRKALKILAMSAEYGHIEAQYSVGRLSDAFSYPLSFSRKREVEWLRVALESGSATCRRRLQELEPEIFMQVARDIRYRYGFNCPKTNRSLIEESQHAKKSADPFEALFASFYEVAITGNIQLFHKLPKCRKDIYNCQNVLGETPLLVACRGGHVAVAKLLLERGADVTIATNDGVTPLHFLSAFDGEHIEEMASLLLHHGAEIDKVCNQALIYKELPDSPFGAVEGTPLLWAVAARNRYAVQTLVGRGADPFMTGNPSDASDEEAFEEYVEISAIIWAAMFHQHDLIDIMLSPARKSETIRQHLRASLNPTRGKHPGALHAAVDCNPGFRFREYLIHGNQFEEAALRCVQLLIQFGADPTLLTRNQKNPVVGDDLIFAACISGNMSTIKYLWDYQNGSLRPSPEAWLRTLAYVIFHRILTVFDFLIEHRRDIDPNSDIDIKAVERSFTLTNDQHIVLGVLELVLQPSAACLPSHYKDLFVSAVLTDQFDAARLVFQSGCFSAAARMDDRTFLGYFIAVSPKFPNMQQKISFILSLPAEKDELFWNVLYRGGTGVTALQAIICTSTPKVPMDAGIFTAIIKHFHEPKHLNTQIGGNPRMKLAGFSALHLAAQYSVPWAVTELSAQSGIMPNLLNARGLTPTDICISLEQKFSSVQQLYESREDKPSFDRKRQVNMVVLDKLLAAGGRIARFSTVIIRLSEDDCVVLDRAKGNMLGVSLLDLLKSNVALSKSSRSLVAYTPVGGLLAFPRKRSQTDSKLPLDLRVCVRSLWNAS